MRQTKAAAAVTRRPSRSRPRWRLVGSRGRCRCPLRVRAHRAPGPVSGVSRSSRPPHTEVPPLIRSPYKRWNNGKIKLVNQRDSVSGVERGLTATRSSSCSLSQALRSRPLIGKQPIRGRSNQLRRKSRSCLLGQSSLARKACLSKASSGLLAVPPVSDAHWLASETAYCTC